MGGDAAALEAAIGYKFRDANLLSEALTHSSTAGALVRGRRRAPSPISNERLEFLGDRVLGLVVARALIEAFPTAREGALTKRSQVLVSRQTLCEVAQEIGLMDHLQTSNTHGELSETTNKMLADACEALIGAIYLDGGIEAASVFVASHWRERMLAMREVPRDPKMTLQEWALNRALPLPRYSVVRSDGPAHAPRFTVEVTVEGKGTGVGEGGSKRHAEQMAAGRLLAELEGSRA